MYREIMNHEIAESLKNGQKVNLAVWRAIKTEFLNYEKSQAGNVLTDDVEYKIISKMVAQRKDAAEQYRNGGRDDLAKNEEQECLILSILLPKEPSDNDIADAIIIAKGELKKQYGEGFVASMKNMKEIQAIVKQKYPTADGGKIAKIFKENIN